MRNRAIRRRIDVAARAIALANWIRAIDPVVSFEILFVHEVLQTVGFRKWLMRISDAETKARLVRRIERLRSANLGDHRRLGGGLLELREHFGPGYRIYVTFRSAHLIEILCGGDKRTQWSDIEKARMLIDSNGAEE